MRGLRRVPDPLVHKFCIDLQSGAGQRRESSLQARPGGTASSRTAEDAQSDAQEEADQTTRLEYYAEAQQLIVQDAINVILGYPNRAIGAAANVQGLVLSPIGNIVLRDIDIV